VSVGGRAVVGCGKHHSQAASPGGDHPNRNPHHSGKKYDIGNPLLGLGSPSKRPKIYFTLNAFPCLSRACAAWKG
jgi:hypothetical protein